MISLSYTSGMWLHTEHFLGHGHILPPIIALIITSLVVAVMPSYADTTDRPRNMCWTVTISITIALDNLRRQIAESCRDLYQHDSKTLKNSRYLQWHNNNNNETSIIKDNLDVSVPYHSSPYVKHTLSISAWKSDQEMLPWCSQIISRREFSSSITRRSTGKHTVFYRSLQLSV